VQKPLEGIVFEVYLKSAGSYENAKPTERDLLVTDEHGYDGNSRLKHYFDIGDTHESRFSRSVPIWRMDLRYEAEVIESLGNSFGDLEDNSDLAAALISAAHNAVDDKLSDYLNELMYCREDSFLEELDDLNVEVKYRTTLQNSVAYMLLVRCGIDPAEYLDFEGFRFIADFNTRNTVNALGTAASDISETCLREISVTVSNLQRQEQNQNRTFATPPSKGDNSIKNSERSFEHGRTDISDRGRLSSAQSAAPGGSRPGIRHTGVWQVRIGKKEVPQTEPPNPVHEPADIGQAERAPNGNRADGERTHGTDGVADGGGAGRDGGTQSPRPNDVDGLDEQHPSQRGGTGDERTDIRIKPLPSQAQQLTLFGEAEESKPSAFSISQQIIDEALTTSGNEENSVLRIISCFRRIHTPTENAAFLRKEYGEGGKGFIFGGQHISVWFDQNVIRIAVGDNARYAENATAVHWLNAELRIRELFQLGRFAPQSELDKADGFELKSLADHLWYLHHDLADGVTFSFMEEELFSGGFPDSTARITELLADPATREEIFDGLTVFAAAYEQDNDLLRFRFSVSRMRDALDLLDDLQYDPTILTADESVSVPNHAFITQDEVDEVLTNGTTARALRIAARTTICPMTR
jgi:hypothetical protein